ncbi:PBP1A family penicillin-binding protein [Paenibacillus allorhizosphaerae]|uniref:Biosynthetic peptidoglycan transglycosylase n=1 Tax=Paenibacillus allorhizosphaerae TaxID=2849866 RepID=A0ABM8VLH9_9BACL|nr:PBP1A family penicillin-binding protein [Paenibacillus allorhizosphaerae]CAG7648401.1 Biosynthetic peptidoglycan transglycosylase [Paenibacillus allorhizosphaerae]
MAGTNRNASAQPTKQTTKPKSGKRKKKKITAGKVFAWAFVSAAVAAICAMGVYIFIIINGGRILTQNIDKLDLDEASLIYDVSGKEVAVLAAENRESVTAAEIPKKLRDAFIATEDKRFEEHAGIDFLGIGRALVKDVVARSMVEGGSTITQQLAKNVFLSADKTFFRKATEMSIAVALEERYSKDDILEKYLNRIFFGNRAYGVKAASKKYFGISDLNQLKLWQMATLAAIPKAPSTYNPISNPEKSKDRRGVVLKLMADQGYITEAERAEAAAVDYVPQQGATKDQYQTYVDYVLREAQNKYNIEEDDLMRGGYKIYTSLNPDAQKIMEQTYANDKLFQKDGPEQKMQSSMVILDNKDGGIVAMIGGRDYVARGLNRAVQQPRQPGSSFKTIVAYAPALESGNYTPYSMLPDEQKSYNGYSPRNYDGVYRGQVSMFEAVKKSINAPAVALLNEIGVNKGIAFLKKLGIELDKNDNNLAIALGGLTKGVTTLQMAQAYSAFPNNGNMNEAHAISKIENSDGSLRAAFKSDKKSVMSAKTAWYMTQLLQGVVEPGGTGTAAKFDRPVAGKTGSTQLDIKGLEKYNRDLWFVGYTPEWTAAVWMGFDKTDSKHYVSMSSGGAAVIFKEVMQKALAKTPMTAFVKPDGVPDLGAPPKTIADLKGEYVKESRTVKLSWSAIGDNVNYQLFRKDSKTAEFPSEPLLSTTSTEVNDISAIQPDTYQYAVVPVNTVSNVAGARSNTVTVTVSADSGHPDPLNPQPGTGNGTGLPGQGGITQPGGAGNGTGQPGQGGTTQPGSGNGTGRPGQGGTTQPGTGTGQPGQGGTTQPGIGTGTGQPGQGGTTQPGTGTGTGQPGQGGTTQPGTGTGTGQPGQGGTTQPGTGTGTGQPGQGGTTQPGTGTGTGQPGQGGTTQPGTGTGTGQPGQGGSTQPGVSSGTGQNGTGAGNNVGAIPGGASGNAANGGERVFSDGAGSSTPLAPGIR